MRKILTVMEYALISQKHQFIFWYLYRWILGTLNSTFNPTRHKSLQSKIVWRAKQKFVKKKKETLENNNRIQWNLRYISRTGSRDYSPVIQDNLFDLQIHFIFTPIVCFVQWKYEIRWWNDPEIRIKRSNWIFTETYEPTSKFHLILMYRE